MPALTSKNSAPSPKGFSRTLALTAVQAPRESLLTSPYAAISRGTSELPKIAGAACLTTDIPSRWTTKMAGEIALPRTRVKKEK